MAATRESRKYSACLREAAKLGNSLNDLDQSGRSASDAIRSDRRIGNTKGESEGLSLLTTVALWRKDPGVAERAQLRAVSLAEKTGDRITMAKAYSPPPSSTIEIKKTSNACSIYKRDHLGFFEKEMIGLERSKH